jgi:hypothetical protein
VFAERIKVILNRRSFLKSIGAVAGCVAIPIPLPDKPIETKWITSNATRIQIENVFNKIQHETHFIPYGKIETICMSKQTITQKQADELNNYGLQIYDKEIT